jgi:hypothetical protein
VNDLCGQRRARVHAQPSDKNTKQTKQTPEEPLPHALSISKKWITIPPPSGSPLGRRRRVAAREATTGGRGNMPREGFTQEQEDAARERQRGKCPCCGRSLSHVGCGWDAHHRNGDPSDSRSSNLVLVCVDCHHNCYHDEEGISRKPIRCRVMDPYE